MLFCIFVPLLIESWCCLFGLFYSTQFISEPSSLKADVCVCFSFRDHLLSLELEIEQFNSTTESLTTILTEHSKKIEQQKLLVLSPFRAVPSPPVLLCCVVPRPLCPPVPVCSRLLTTRIWFFFFPPFFFC